MNTGVQTPPGIAHSGQPEEPWNPTGRELSMRNPALALPIRIGRRGSPHEPADARRL